VFRKPSVPQIDARSVPDTAVLLDVREHEEWVAGHAEGAVHVPLGQLPGRLGDVPDGSEVVVVCRSGARSAQATAWLAAQGRRAANLDGGMQAWVAAGRPMVSESGAPPTVA